MCSATNSARKRAQGLRTAGWTGANKDALEYHSKLYAATRVPIRDSEPTSRLRSCIRHMNLLYSDLPAFANCCYDGLLAVVCWLTARSGLRGVVVVLVLVRPSCAW